MLLLQIKGDSGREITDLSEVMP